MNKKRQEKYRKKRKMKEFSSQGKGLKERWKNEGGDSTTLKRVTEEGECVCKEAVW